MSISDPEKPNGGENRENGELRNNYGRNCAKHRKCGKLRATTFIAQDKTSLQGGAHEHENAHFCE